MEPRYSNFGVDRKFLKATFGWVLQQESIGSYRSGMDSGGRGRPRARGRRRWRARVTWHVAVDIRQRGREHRELGELLADSASEARAKPRPSPIMWRRRGAKAAAHDCCCCCGAGHLMVVLDVLASVQVGALIKNCVMPDANNMMPPYLQCMSHSSWPQWERHHESVASPSRGWCCH
jgi:hypothetical protein